MTDTMERPTMGEWEEAPAGAMHSSGYPHYMTDNELYGMGELDENGGTWLVNNPSGVTVFVATNRVAAEAAVYTMAKQAHESAQEWSITVWKAQDEYPGDDANDPLVGLYD